MPEQEQEQGPVGEQKQGQQIEMNDLNEIYGRNLLNYELTIKKLVRQLEAVKHELEATKTKSSESKEV